MRTQTKPNIIVYQKFKLKGCQGFEPSENPTEKKKTVKGSLQVSACNVLDVAPVHAMTKHNRK